MNLSPGRYGGRAVRPGTRESIASAQPVGDGRSESNIRQRGLVRALGPCLDARVPCRGRGRHGRRQTRRRIRRRVVRWLGRRIRGRLESRVRGRLEGRVRGRLGRRVGRRVRNREPVYGGGACVGANRWAAKFLTAPSAAPLRRWIRRCAMQQDGPAHNMSWCWQICPWPVAESGDPGKPGPYHGSCAGRGRQRDRRAASARQTRDVGATPPRVGLVASTPRGGRVDAA